MNRRVYIHRFVGSDPMRGWHDHPWFPAVSVVLWGEYGEERCEPSEADYLCRHVDGAVTKLRISTQRVRWYNILRERTAHRVVIGDDWTPGVHGSHKCTSRSPECWTLFVHPTEYINPWGFWRNFATTKLGPNHYRWYAFDDDKGIKTSGAWWDTAPLGSSHPDRLPAVIL
jgi:hypothetical protein